MISRGQRLDARRRRRSVRVFAIAAISALVGAVLAPARAAGEPSWSPHLFGPIARDAHAAAFTVYNDGTGPALYAAGAFDRAGGVTGLGGVAKWNGTGWEAVGGGANGVVFGLCVFNGELVASGLFTSAGGVPCNRIARWNGTAWAPLGSGLDGFALSLVEFQGQLYAAGGFLTAGGVPAMNIARWNGSNWSAVGTPPSGTQINTLFVHAGKLWAGGLFTQGASANVATWDGALWEGVGTGTPASVYALAEFDGQVIAGEAVSAGGLGLQAWNGATWTTLGGGVNGSVFELAVHNGELHVLGDFTSAGASPVSYLARWNGSTWSAVGPAFPEPLSQIPTNDMISYVGDLIVGTAGAGALDTPVHGGVGRWNGAAWSALGGGLGWQRQGQGISGRVAALRTYGSELIAAGRFRRAGDTQADNIARWNGHRWAPLGSGVSGSENLVESLLEYNGDLIVGGWFLTAGGLSAPGIARWNGTTWQTLGTGMNGPVFGMCQFNGDLIAGGSFGTAGGVAARRIARWNGSSWSALGSGIEFVAGTHVSNVLAYQGELIAAGNFATAGGQSASNIARWNGAAWSPLGSGVNGSVSALAIHENKLIVGGSFTSAGGLAASGIALWDGAFWSAIGAGIGNPGGGIFDLEVHDGDVWAAGIFTTISGVNCNSLARWDGSQWHALPQQPGFNIYDLATLSDGFSEQPALYVGGNFFGVDGTTSRGLARYGEGPTVSRLYVDASAPPAGNGLTWDTAFASLRQALIAAELSNGTVEEIWVADGTYTPTVPDGDRAQSFYLVDGVAVYGGFAGIGVYETSLSERNPDVNTTILSGDLNGDDGPNFANYSDNSYHVVTAIGVDATTVLDGFTIIAGNANSAANNADQGGGLFNDGGSPTVVGCTLTENRATAGGGAAANLGGAIVFVDCVFTANTANVGTGGAMHNLKPSQVTLRECAFYDNTAGSGAAVFDQGASLQVSRCLFGNNISSFNSGAIGLDSGVTATLVNCFFHGNQAQNGSAGALNVSDGSSATVVNCVFSGNSATGDETSGRGGAVRIAGTDPTPPFCGIGSGSCATLVNCTFAGNSTNRLGGGVFISNQATVSIRNCAFWGNVDETGTSATAQIHEGCCPVSVNVSYCLVQGGHAGSGNINSDPLFRDPDGPDNILGTLDDDLRLMPASPAIDAGDNSAIPPDTLDLDGDGNTAEPTPIDALGNGRRRDFWSVPDTGVGTAPLVDIGAYEHVGGQVLVSPNPAATAWVDDTNSLQAALAFARGYPGEVTEIWIAAGTHKPDHHPGVITPGDRAASFEPVSGVILYGGFSGSETQLNQRDIDANVTILSGDLLGNDGPNFANYGENSRHVVRATTPGAGFHFLDGLTIRGGNADGTVPASDGHGGGVYANAASVYLVLCRLIENRAIQGGGFYATGVAAPQILGCVVQNNAATDDGGAMFFTGAACTPTIISSSFSGNSAADAGGAVASAGAAVRVRTNCSFTSNAAARGGAMYFSGLPNSLIDHALFERNTASGTGGGAVYSTSTSPRFFNCRFLGNDVNGAGTGGAVHTNVGTPQLVNSLFVGNESNGGGACDFNNGNPIVANCTIAQNRVAANPGGAFRLNNSNAAMSNCIVYDNPSTGEMIHLLGTSAPVLMNCIVQGGWPAGTDIVDADPVFIRRPSPGPDGNWDGIDDDYGDLQLYFFSPAIDVGAAAQIPLDAADLDGDMVVAEPVPVDLDGAPRQREDLSVANGGAAGSPPVDMGAYEFAPPVATTPIVRVNLNAAGGNNGTSWADAYTDLQAALCAAANSNGLATQLWVAKGVYKPGRPGDPRTAAFRLFNDLAMYGHFAGTETHLTQRNLSSAANETVLSGDLNANDDPWNDVEFAPPATWNENSYHVVWANGFEESLLDGFTITHGYANVAVSQNDSGAGILIDDAGLTVRSCQLSKNFASLHGGGAYVTDSYLPTSASRLEACVLKDNHALYGGGLMINGFTMLAVEDCDFQGNYANSEGGGARCVGGDHSFRRCQFENNYGGNGGGGLVLNAAATIVDCSFQRNRTLGDGGAVHLVNIGNTIVRSSFTQNHALLTGGAMYLSNATSSTLVNLSFLGNSAASAGAMNCLGSSPAVTNCMFVGNSARTGQGGAAYLGSSSPVIANCTFSDNAAASTGGAVFTSAGGPALRNCILTRNSSNYGADLGETAQIYVQVGGISIDHSLVQGWTGSFESLPGWGGGTGNFTADPVFLRRPSDGGDGFGDNPATPAIDEAANDDYGDLRLAAGSPALDRGNNALIAPDVADLDCDGNTAEPMPFDLNGAPRRVDDVMTEDCDGLPAGSCGTSPIVDIGAYERGPIIGDQVFVNASAPGPVHDGTSWATAFTHIQDALNYTGSLGCGAIEVWVARGTYMPDGGYTPFGGAHVNGSGDPAATFQLQMSVVIYGGFAGDEDPATFDLATRNFAANPTILSGDLLGDDPGNVADNAWHVVTGTGTTDIAILDGFTIAGGVAANPPSGGGFITLADGPFLRRCSFTGNKGECAGGLDSIGGRLTVEDMTTSANVSAAGHGVGLTHSRVELIGDWSIEAERADVFGTVFSGPGRLMLGSGALLKVRSVPPCNADIITRAGGTMSAAVVFVPAEVSPPQPAQWKIADAAVVDVVLTGANTTVYIAPTAQGGPPATLTWMGNFIEQDLSAGGLAEAHFHWGGVFTLTGELYDGPGPGATLLNPGQPTLLVASVGSFHVRETAAGSNTLKFVALPTLAPTGGFLVANAAGFILAGEQKLDAILAAAAQNGGDLANFNSVSTIALTGPSSLTLEPLNAPSGAATTYSDIRGTGDIVIDAGARLVLAGYAVLNLSGLPDDVCATGEPPGAPPGGTVTVAGTLLAQDNARVHNTTINVNLADLQGATQIAHNDVSLVESAPGFGGEFFVSGGAVISCNVITSEGDRYLDLDPNPAASPRPVVENNKFHVLIKQGLNAAQGELLELRSRDHDIGLFGGLSGAHPLASSAGDGVGGGYNDTWVLESLTVLPGAKVTLTNRAGFDFDPGSAIPEALYVKNLVLGANSVLNTGLQRLYYQSISADPTATFVDHPLLGFSLKVIAFDDPTAPPHNEFDVRVRARTRDPADVQPTLPPFKEGAVTHEFGLIPGAPNDGVMRMQTKADCQPPAPCPLAASSVAAHGAFARAGEDFITVAFEYKFCGNSNAATQLRVYLSDQPEVAAVADPASTPGFSPLLATIHPPASGPGSVGGTGFATFSGSFPRGSLNFTRGTYVALVLVSPTGAGQDGCVLINNWDPFVCGSTTCGDLGGASWFDYVVTNADFLYLLARQGEPVGATNWCADRMNGDSYVDLGDLLLWDAQLHSPNMNLCFATGTNDVLPAAAGASPGAQPLILSGLRRDALDEAGQPPKFPTLVYGFNPATATTAAGILPPGAAASGDAVGYGRLTADKDGRLHHLHGAYGLVRASDGVAVVPPMILTPTSDSTVSVHVGYVSNGDFPLTDAAFHATDAAVVYVAPVRVVPNAAPGEAYRAAARLRLTGSPPAGQYVVERVYGVNPWQDPENNTTPPEYSQFNVQKLREIEVDALGNVFVASAKGENGNDWLLIYRAADGFERRIQLVIPEPDPPLRAPGGLMVSRDGATLYLASSIDDADPGSTQIYRFGVTHTGDEATGLTYQGIITVNGMRQVTALAQDRAGPAATAAVHALGYAASFFPPTHTFANNDPLFTTAMIATLPAAPPPQTATAVAITGPGPAGEQLALPIGAAFVNTCLAGDLSGDGQVTYADVAPFVAALLAGAVPPQDLCRVDFNADGAVNGHDVAGFVEAVLP